MRKTKKVTLTKRSPSKSKERRFSGQESNLLHLMKRIKDHKSPRVLMSMSTSVSSEDHPQTREGTMEEKEEGTTRSTMTKRDTLTADTTRTRGDPTRRKALRDTILSHLIRTLTLTMRKDPSLKDFDQITTLPTVMLTKETQDTLSRCLSEKETSEMAHHHLTLKMDILLEAHL